MNTGEPRLKELREQAADERIEVVVGRELRSLMHRAVPEPGNRARIAFAHRS